VSTLTTDTGWHLPTSLTNQTGTGWSITGTTSNWQNPTNAGVDSDTFADTVSTISTTVSSALLLLRTFSFGIPSSATILGIAVEIQVRSNSASPDAAKDLTVGLASTTTLIGTAKADATPYTLGTGATFDTKVYGGAADLWSWTPSVATANGANFGCGLVSIGNGAAAKPNVRRVRMKVYYSTTAGIVGHPRWLIGRKN